MAIRPKIVDILIIGGGPAGLTAALGCARTRCLALLFDSGSYRNEGITHMHSVPSRDHIDPVEFRRIAREQIESRYDSVWFEKATIVSAVKKMIGEKQDYEGFELKDSEGREFWGKKLIVATGSRDVFPDIPGFAENWPSHMYCLACDGYEQRNSPIGVLEFNSPMAVHFASMAFAFDSRVTIFSNGPVADTPPIQHALKVAYSLGAKLDSRKIKRLINNGPTHTEGVTIEFESGGPVTLGFLVNKPPTVNRAQDLVEMLGLETGPPEMGGNVVVKDMFNETSVKGVFAAGDTMVLMKQVTVAAAEGLKALAGAGKQIGEENMAEALRKYEAANGA
ncbi:FAD/NAD(P)-binding domain-containing protein [Amniculicola lignicola CBS 123094]|uniref:FAD/NAD(P)-binding domain-containing protein n=1 Tax=Amniculicola lignicola CBS 123094 TaxID=1392246 RepID=A0A6A5W6C3_9PLEO|nr:FAD/NAD(P)-binding domain-containing protein [Amniculicola lignicola CBS 123094]